MGVEPAEVATSEYAASDSAAEVAARLGLGDSCVRQLDALQGKSAAYGGGRANLLLSHQLDTAAVAELMWVEYLAPSVRGMLDRVSGGDGRRFFMWLCGIHDVGKATPAFQAVDDAGQRRVRAAGLGWPDAVVRTRRRRWRHDKAGGRIVRDVLKDEWPTEAVAWVWPLVAGHHGNVPPVSVYRPGAGVDQLHGVGKDWRAAQRNVLEVLTRCLGYRGLRSVRPVVVPSRAEQLCLSGLVVMADWIASDTSEGRFQGLERLDDVSLERARQRAEKAWRALKLRGGWSRLPVPMAEDLVRQRFGEGGRASQLQLVEMARAVPAPGLLFVEGPMGEGKTKAMLAAVEVLAARFGADGMFLGMPTQATCDPMYEVVRGWVKGISPGLEDHVALLHGKRAFNPTWREVWRPAEGNPEEWYGSVGEDEFGLDEYGIGAGGNTADADLCCSGGSGPSEWFLERKRGLLSPFVVGTIDQLLFAATRTKHVMLRFAGLAGKVVVLDEVHAADVYMRQFLTEALRWLGQARVPVVMLSATLPPAQRRMLARAYLEGSLGRVGVDVSEMPEPAGYPSVTAVFGREDGTPGYRCESTEPWRKTVPVALQWLPDVTREDGAVAERVRAEVAEGGVALVVLNQVERAQQVYEKLAGHFPGEVILLHGRLCAAHRAERTQRCLNALGPNAGDARPHRMIIVATQLAEQSFDVDADLLVTDLAPIDLLLQRIGRLHRHARTRRPAHLRTPTVLVTGIAGNPAPGDRDVPGFLGASERIYGAYRLLRTASLITREAGPPRLDADSGRGERNHGAWSIPERVPELVAEVYDQQPLCPPSWRSAEERAGDRWNGDQDARTAKAEKYLLCQRGQWAKPTLEGLHHAGIGAATDEELREAVVRDGEMAGEVVLVRRSRRGFHALDGTWLGVHGEASEHETTSDAALGGTVRLPVKPGLGEAVDKELRPLDGWGYVQGLRYVKALVLEEDGCARLAGYVIGYDDLLGLTVEDEQGRSRTSHT